MEAILDKTDLLKADRLYYRATAQPALVDLDSYYYLTHEGKGSPSDEPFNLAIERLYSAAYGIKFLCKSEDMDFVVPKMEGIWWIDGGLDAQRNFTKAEQRDWNWKIVIRMPDFVEVDHFYRSVKAIDLKRPGWLEDQLKFELMKEGRCVQMLHLGSYHEEEPTVHAILNFIQENGLKVNRYHREIYLSDPRRTEESKLKTIIRYGVE